jgi:ABC-type Zn uptake system ZnuABC Zn-binding protein ZnuA
MITLKSYLESNNIPYIFFDAINPTKVIIDNSSRQFKIRKYANSSEYSVEHIANFDTMINDNNLKYIYDNNYISFNGLSMNEWLWREGETLFEFLTNDNDGHPNELASKELASYILNEYARLYNK